MTIHNNVYNMNNPYCSPNFREGFNPASAVSKPIEQVETFVSNTYDRFVPSDAAEVDEEEQKSHKRGVKVFSAVLVLSTLVAILNPKSLNKISAKFKAWSAKAGAKGAENTLSGKLYRGWGKFLDKTVKLLDFSNNINTVKDEGFQYLCTHNKKMSWIKNDTLRNGLIKIDNGFVKVMKTPHKEITKWFDKISKQTVYGKYKKVNDDLKELNNLIEHYKKTLPNSERQVLENKLAEIRRTQSHFTNDSVKKRLENQEILMSHLEDDTLHKMGEYYKAFRTKGTNKGQYFNDNLNFWAEEIMMKERNQIEQNGLQVVHSLVGNGKTQKGMYNEILEILSPHLKPEESKIFEDYIKKVSNTLNKANKSECVEYFDKKRDLMLGSAPTDILTAFAGIIMSGVAIGTANDNEERISKAITTAFPVVAGMGVSMATTAMLYSGVKGMAIGAISGLGLSRLGSLIDKKVIKDRQLDIQQDNIPQNPYDIPKEIGVA